MKLRISIVIFIISILTVIDTVWADDDSQGMLGKGPYVNLGFGVGITAYGSATNGYMGCTQDIIPRIFSWGLLGGHNINFAGKAAIGGNFSRNFGAEFDYYNFSGPHWKSDDDVISEKYTTAQQALALVVVGRVPIITDKQDIYFKLGAAYTWVTMHLSYNDPSGAGPYWNRGQANYDRVFKARAVQPLLGIGYEVNFNEHLAAFTELAGVLAPKEKSLSDPHHTRLEPAFLLSFGLGYRF